MIVLKGLQGPVTVKGQKFGSAVMQPWDKTLTDQKIADVLTYERSEWGNSASPVTAEQIATLRKELANHPNHSVSMISSRCPTKIFRGCSRRRRAAKTRRSRKTGRAAEAAGLACRRGFVTASRVEKSRNILVFGLPFAEFRSSYIHDATVGVTSVSSNRRLPRGLDFGGVTKAPRCWIG